MASLREMREHVGVDPTAIVAGTVPANRHDRRLAARVLREKPKGQYVVNSAPFPIVSSDAPLPEPVDSLPARTSITPPEQASKVG